MLDKNLITKAKPIKLLVTDYDGMAVKILLLWRNGRKS